VVVGVVTAVTAAVSAVVPLIETEVGDRLHVTGLVGLERLVVTAQVRLTVPVNEFSGVTVICEVLPLVAPAVTVMLPPLASVKPELPAGAAQKFLQPARKPHPRSPIPKTAMLKTRKQSGAPQNSRALNPDFIPAPFSTSSDFKLFRLFQFQGYRFQSNSVCSLGWTDAGIRRPMPGQRTPYQRTHETGNRSLGLCSETQKTQSSTCWTLRLLR
jgi:hypothetical protein